IDILNKHKHPALLFRKAKAKDYSGRTINASPYQAALGAEDTDMLQMMETYFDQITDGRKQALAQYNEQFPNGVKDAPCDFDFSPLVAAITNDKVIVRGVVILSNIHNYFPNEFSRNS
ncbi:MAG: hypothetical protein ACD_46C00271G0002, partial [uncultured bacterium]